MVSEGELNFPCVLIVLGDDDGSMDFRQAFQTAGYSVYLARSPEEALHLHPKIPGPIVVIDDTGDSPSTEKLMADFKEADPDCVLVLLTDPRLPDHSLAFVQKGAADCLRKPVDPAYLVNRCSRALKEKHLLCANTNLENRNRELLGRENSLKAIFETFDDIHYQTDPEGIVTMISPSVFRLSGWTPDEIVGQPVTKVYDDPDTRQLLLKAVLEQGFLKDYELRLVKKDGTKSWVSLAAHLVRDPDGRICGVAGSLRDISQRKKMEQDLKESEEKFRILTESSPAAIMLYQNNKWVYVNNAATEITGFSMEEFRSMDFWDIVHPDDKAMIRERGMRRQRNQDAVTRYEFKIITKAGQVKWLYLSGATTLLGGKPAGIISVHDINDRVLAEDSLKKSEERFRTILDDMEVGYLEVDLEGKLTFYNEAFQRIFGYTRNGRLNTDSEACTPEQDIAGKIYDAYNRMFRTGFPLQSFEWEINQEDGAKRTFELSASLLKDKDDQPSGFRGIVRDITERRQTEEERERLQNQLNQVQKLDSVGRLAGGVAHDFNNMLGVILGRTEIGLMHAEPGHPLYRDLTEIRKAAERSSDLTRQLLAFARKQTVAPKIIDLNTMVESMLKMLQRLIGEDIDLAWLPTANLPKVKMDPSQLDQILANLCVNARDAIESVGKVTIETDTADIDEAQSACIMGIPAGQYVVLSVSDNGCGMDKDVQEKLFEPFFTTKRNGLGTGLGLATVYGIVVQNNGFIDVYSEPGLGSLFKIFFPAHLGPSDKTADEEAGKTNGGAETVLLVEDESMIREMTVMMLEYLGYKVFSASRPSEALDLIKNQTEGFHLLLTDVVMPEMNGRDLAAQLLKTHPGLKCLFMSGYTADVIAHHGVLDQGVNFIQKPFALKDLAARIRMTLDHQSR